MSVIEAAAMRCRTMADGSLRIEVEVEPRNAQAAFMLFGSPGRAVALAALKDGAGAVAQPEPEKRKGGEWAKLAGMWCADRDFWMFCSMQFSEEVSHAEHAALLVRELCGIASRAELDHNADALKRFNDVIRHPFMKFMVARGIQK